MAQDRSSLERQLSNAKQALAAYEQRRDADEAKTSVVPKKDPKWRQLDKARRDVVTRLKRVEALEAQLAEMESRRQAEAAAD